MLRPKSTRIVPMEGESGLRTPSRIDTTLLTQCPLSAYRLNARPRRYGTRAAFWLWQMERPGRRFPLRRTLAGEGGARQN